jgi:hypothetical protein
MAGAFGRPVPQMPPQAMPAGPPEAPDGDEGPQAGPPSGALAALAAMASKLPSKPSAPTKKAKPKFEPGKKPEPKSGFTVHDVFKDEGLRGQLHGAVRDWQKRNPGKKMRGSHLKAEYMPHVSDQQAANIMSKHHKQMSDAYHAKGALTAIKKG